MDAPIERYIYDCITEELERVFGECRYDAKTFREHVRKWQRSDLRDFRDWLNDVLLRVSTAKYKLDEGIERLTWREVKVVSQKFKACECCGRIFYDLSRNGRKEVCHYLIYEWWNKSKRRYQFRLKSGRSMSVCEVERDDGKLNNTSKSIGLGRATSYSYTTRIRMERQMLIWTSFQPSNDAEEAYIRKVELSQSSHAINGKYKPAVVNAAEWPINGSHKPEIYYANVKEVLGKEGESMSVVKYNVFDLPWSEVVARGLDVHFSKKSFYETQQLRVKTT